MIAPNARLHPGGDALLGAGYQGLRRLAGDGTRLLPCPEALEPRDGGALNAMIRPVASAGMTPVAARMRVCTAAVHAANEGRLV